ncbi:Scr1 family TA system antitoxin-like transcriptional regulator [Streptosporangium sp. NPDC002524]|uniref:Scr1 family TA system antitoxin-like transcriptional regulator n=1 Tax=Streptosporangium sp. NPDC002524 TaxID=3154537 RepID=UPI00331BED52
MGALEFAARDNGTVQVPSPVAGARPATAGTAATLELRKARDPDVTYVDIMTNIPYVAGDVEMYRYMLSFDHLRAAALSPDESRTLLS